jgi:hypothetical protein
MLWFGLGELRMPARRFPPPWSVEELDACFVVRDGNGQQLASARMRREGSSAILDTSPLHSSASVARRFAASFSAARRRSSPILRRLKPMARCSIAAPPCQADIRKPTLENSQARQVRQESHRAALVALDSSMPLSPDVRGHTPCP